MGRERTSKRKLVFTAAILEDCQRRVQEGESKRKVAESIGVNEDTLRKRLRLGTVPKSLGRYTKVFSEEQEAELAAHCRTLDGLFYGLKRRDLMSLAYQYAQLNNIPNPFNKDKQSAGKDWVRGFCKRHDLVFRTPENVSLGRAIIGFNKAQVDRYFSNLSACLQKGFPPHRIFNMDETGISTVASKLPKVCTARGKRTVGKVTSGERGLVTAVCCFSASGVYVPPALIFPRKKMSPELYNAGPSGTLPLISDSGFINSELFVLQWLQHYARHVKPSEEDPALLLLDNHVSHCSLQAIQFARDKYITLLTLPPHASHKPQPLDVGFFGPLKSAYAYECDKWMINHPGQGITLYNVATLFRAAYTVDKAEKAFEVSVP